MMATTLRSWWNKINARNAPTPAEGSVERIVIGWIKLSYRHAKNNIDGHKRRKDQQWHVGK